MNISFKNITKLISDYLVYLKIKKLFKFLSTYDFISFENLKNDNNALLDLMKRFNLEKTKDYSEEKYNLAAEIIRINDVLMSEKESLLSRMIIAYNDKYGSDLLNDLKYVVSKSSKTKDKNILVYAKTLEDYYAIFKDYEDDMNNQISDLLKK